MLPNGYTTHFSTAFSAKSCRKSKKIYKKLKREKNFQNEVIHLRQTKTANLFVHEPTVSHFLRLR